jgi:FAD/FMN-containing dehydrogenase
MVDGLTALRGGFAGEVITPNDAGYDDARRVWNAVYDQRPAVLVRPTSTNEVATAIRFAREHDLEIAIRAGGHSAAGHSTCEGGLVIDLSGLRGVTVDADRRTARANGGALLGELDVAAQQHGLVCPVGVVGHTGVAGLTLGGGMGRLQRNFGFTLDNLQGVELVTADGRIVRASAIEEPELFWGVRGAGPNFGVVTAFEFSLHPFGPKLHRGMQIYPGSQVHEAYGLFREYAAVAPDAVALTFVIGLAEPASDYPESVGGQPIAIISYNHSGDPALIERDLAPLRAGPKPVATTDASHVYLDIQAANDTAMGWGHRTYIKGAFTDDLRPETLDALVAHAAAAPGEASFSMTALGGAISRVPDDATAFAGRQASFEMSADSSWEAPAEDEVNRGWVRKAMAIVEPDAVVGRYVNEIAEFGPEETRAIYGDAKLAKLRTIKRAWDPDNVFHRNHNVAP